jgi:hypothetical protein
MTTTTIKHIVPNAELRMQYVERLNRVAQYYFNTGAALPADLHVARSLILNGVFGNETEKAAQVIWINRTVKRAEAVVAEDRLTKQQPAAEQAIEEGVKKVAEAKNQPRRRAPAKKRAAKKTAAPKQ